ncbi:MAG: branched-chain amino acid aminotransferase [Propionibacteriaceae bacterium]|jgi:branched-chain amino acid aminotransferase|nr:branched-chain amino acid aminotransferase [Propionibacteriaceae bacterium]
MALSFTRQDTTTTPTAEIEKVLADPGFGVNFTDHMATATWSADQGWHDGALENYHPFDLDPGVAVFHYGQEIFEGLKAYRWSDGSIWVFRPEMNARRFQRSAQRMELPVLDEADFLASIDALITADAAWVPSADEMSLYVRPFLFASESFLGVRSSNVVQYAAIASPAAPYFEGGIGGVDIWVTTTYSRVGSGGTGAAKCGGNYAASLIAQNEGARHGCAQVLFTDAATHTWIEELGGMNFFVVTADDRLLTPPTSGTILEGITRDSILTLAPEIGLAPEEKPLTLDEVLAGIVDGEITEAFACGTAAVVTPIRSLRREVEGHDEDVVLTHSFGPKTAKIRQTLVDIQWGRTPDRHEWMRRIA